MTGNIPRVRLGAPSVQPAVRPRPPAAPTRYQRFVKPLLDRTAGILLSMMAAPVLGVIALAVMARLGSPVLLRQERVGRDGRVFKVFKFRTMHPDRRVGTRPIDFPDRRRTHKHPDDPRHTPLGRFLRKYSLDELPQMLNVARGEMSLIGPRPELPHIVARYEPWEHARHIVTPGLTGLWQVTERGNGGLMHEHTDIDLRYVEAVTLRQDLWILLNTVPTLLGRRNAGS